MRRRRTALGTLTNQPGELGVTAPQVTYDYAKHARCVDLYQRYVKEAAALEAASQSVEGKMRMLDRAHLFSYRDGWKMMDHLQEMRRRARVYGEMNMFMAEGSPSLAQSEMDEWPTVPARLEKDIAQSLKYVNRTLRALYDLSRNGAAGPRLLSARRLRQMRLHE